jgi:hypothetical protein
MLGAQITLGCNICATSKRKIARPCRELRRAYGLLRNPLSHQMVALPEKSLIGLGAPQGPEIFRQRCRRFAAVLGWAKAGCDDSPRRTDFARVCPRGRKPEKRTMRNESAATGWAKIAPMSLRIKNCPPYDNGIIGSCLVTVPEAGYSRRSRFRAPCRLHSLQPGKTGRRSSLRLAVQQFPSLCERRFAASRLGRKRAFAHPTKKQGPRRSGGLSRGSSLSC